MSSYLPDFFGDAANAVTAAQSGAAAAAGDFSPSATATGAAIGSAIPGIGTAVGAGIGLILDLGRAVSNLFGSTAKTSWEQQDQVIRPLADKLGAGTQAALTADQLGYFTAQYLYHLKRYFSASHIQPANVQAQYLSAPELKETSTLTTLIWLGLHFTFHAAPNFSEYEVKRRTVPILGEVYGAAYADAEAKYGAAGLAKLKNALAGGSAATAIDPSTTSLASLVPEAAQPYLIGGLVLWLVIWLYRKGLE